MQSERTHPPRPTIKKMFNQFYCTDCGNGMEKSTDPLLGNGFLLSCRCRTISERQADVIDLPSRTKQEIKGQKIPKPMTLEDVDVEGILVTPRYGIRIAANCEKCGHAWGILLEKIYQRAVVVCANMANDGSICGYVRFAAPQEQNTTEEEFINMYCQKLD